MEDEKEQNKGAIDLFFPSLLSARLFSFSYFLKEEKMARKKEREAKRKKKKCRHTPLNDRHLVHYVREISELDNIYKKRKGLASGRRWPVALPPAARTF